MVYKLRAAIGIGETRDQQKTREDAEEARVIREVRAYIWRTRFCCQVCGGARQHECAKADEMHEHEPRSATRGRPPQERFNLVNCGRLCEKCHRDVTEHRMVLTFLDPALGFLGPVIGETRH